jgi:hypothetical protein
MIGIIPCLVAKLEPGILAFKVRSRVIFQQLTLTVDAIEPMLQPSRDNQKKQPVANEHPRHPAKGKARLFWPHWLQPEHHQKGQRQIDRAIRELLIKDGRANNYVTFRPKKSFIWLEAKLARADVIHNFLDTLL